MAERSFNHYDDANRAMNDAQDVFLVMSLVLSNTDLPIEGSFRDALGTVARLGEESTRCALVSLDEMQKERRRG